MANTSRMHPTISPGQLAAMDSFFFFRERQPLFPIKTKTSYLQTHATKEEEVQKNRLKPKAGVSS